MDIKQIDNNTGTSYKKGREYFNNLFKTGQIPSCSPGYVSGTCQMGHKFAAPFLCGKEYCKDCGMDGSPIHSRRVSRWANITDQFKKLGYLVFTFPKEVRFLFLDKKILSDYRYQLRRKLTRDGFNKGLARWHFFGDCKTCMGKGCRFCNQTGSGTEWNPHLNLFIDCGFMENLTDFLDNYRRWSKNYILKLLKKEIEKRTLLIEKYGESLDRLDVIYTELEEINIIIEKQKKTVYVIDFSYTNDKKKIINRLKYVTRSTFRVYNAEIKEIIKNFRNSIRWGIKPVKSEIQQHICQECNTPVKFHNLERYHLQTLYIKHYGNTIYQLAGTGIITSTRIKAPPKSNHRTFKRNLPWGKNYA